MAVSPTPPPITPLPAPALPTDPEAVFDTKAGVSLTAQVAMVPEINAALAWVAGALVDTNGYKDAAATSASNAADSAILAGQQVGLAVTARQGAEAARASSEVIAASVQAAAGTPSLIGNGGKALCVKLDETGVEFKPLGQAIGDILLTARTPDATYLPVNSIYLRSSYPELFSLLGTLPNKYEATARTLPASAGWRSVTHGNGLFVAIAGISSSVTATSPDGITWTQRTLPATTGWTAVTHGNGLFVAVAGGGTIAATSPDGITWTQRTLPATTGWAAIAFGRGVFLATSSVGIAATSPDGITWTQRAMPGALGVTYGAGMFVSVGGTAEYASSPDGVTWITRSLAANQPWWRIAYGNGSFVIVASGTPVAVSISVISYDTSTQFATPTLGITVPGAIPYIKAKVA